MIERLKDRKLVQWALAYLAGAWLVWQVTDTLGDRWGLTPAIAQVIDVLLVVGLPVVLVLAWYHAEQERERVSGVELLILALLLGLGAGVIAMLSPRLPDDSASTAPAIVRFAFEAPDQPRLSDLALSPDGARLAFTAEAPGGQSQLWIRSMDSEDAVAIAGTEGATFPFWAHDGRSVAFFQQEQLVSLDLATLSRERMADAPNGRGGAWSEDGAVVFAPAGTGPLHVIPAGGGDPVPITTVNEGVGETGHRFPQFLPDGQLFTFFIGGLRSLGVGSLNDDGHKVLGESWSEGLPVPGHLMFLRESSLMMQQFDQRERELVGEAFPILSPMSFRNPNGNAQATVSSGGVLAYRLGPRRVTDLVWVDRNGNRLESVGERGEHGHARMSPDGTHVLFDRLETAGFFVWTLDLRQGRYERVTRGDFASWADDGSTILFRRGSSDTDLYLKELGSAPDSEVVLVEGVVSNLGSDFSGDGTFMAYSDFDAATADDIWIFDIENQQRRRVVSAPGNQTLPQVSPTGEWIAYESNQTGSLEVYAFSLTDEKHEKVSRAGGEEPRWSTGGRELLYRDPDGSVMAVALDQTGFGPPGPLFQIGSGTLVSAGDGQRILIRESPGDNPRDAIHVVLNWLSEWR